MNISFLARVLGRKKGKDSARSKDCTSNEDSSGTDFISKKDNDSTSCNKDSTSNKDIEGIAMDPILSSFEISLWKHIEFAMVLVYVLVDCSWSFNGNHRLQKEEAK
jgi:hypothetical protein